MKIVFWGSEGACDVTSNMAALAGYLVCQRGFRVTIIDLTKESCDIDRYFSGSHRKYAKEYIDTLIEKGLYYVAQPVSRHIIERIEWNMDVIFINLTNRTDEEARQIMREAELLVVNLKQEEKSFEAFFSHYANLSARLIFLVGNYFENAVCNKYYLQSKYWKLKEHFAVIPANPEFQLACERGELDKYMRRGRPGQLTDMKRKFIKELENTIQIIFEQAKKEMAH